MQLQLVEDNTVVLINEMTGESIPWDVTIFERTRFSTVVDVFRDVNAYWAYIGPVRCATIWNVYKEIYSVWEQVPDLHRLTSKLIELCARIYAEMPAEEIEHWVKLHGNVRYPEGLKLIHDPEDRLPGRTYLRSDYQGLIVLTIALRPMVPIWGEYMMRVKENVGSVWKEYIAMKLLTESTLSKSAPMERLKLYIEACLTTTPINNSAAIVRGLGSAELPDWLLAFVVVRRMAVGDIDAHKEHGSIISNIWGYVSNAIKDLDRKFGGGLKEKRPEDANIEDEGSLLESYKVKEDISAGDVAVFSVYTENIHAMTLRLDPTIPPQLIDKCIHMTMPLTNLNIKLYHKTIVQWVMAMSYVLPAKSIPCLNKQALLRTMAATQAALLHWGFVELAALLTAEAVPHQKDTFITTDARVRVSAEITEQLNALYPHFNQTDKTVKRANYAGIAITAIQKEIAGSIWRVNMPAEYRKQIPTMDNRSQMTCPPNLIEQLSHLTIKLANQEA